MRGVPRRRPRLEPEHLAAHDLDVLLRHGDELAPQPVEVLRVEAARACLQAGRVDEVRRADLADVHPEAGVPANEGAGCARVVQVNVCQEEVAEVREREPLPGQALLERAEARRGAAVDQRRLVTG
jgi:hypothetical protein